MDTPTEITGSLFSKIIEPIKPKLEEIQESMPNDKSTYTLSFIPFTINLLYGIMRRIESIRLLATVIKTNEDARKQKLVTASSSMYSEAFGRYRPKYYRPILYSILSSLKFLGIPEIKALGWIWCVDGSIFPAMKRMAWAKYKSTKNAIKLHLAFELNHMIPIEFICTDANTSEKKVLRSMVQSGITYVLDRGYIQFKLLLHIAKQGAFFVVRAKKNMQYRIGADWKVSLPETWNHVMRNVSDQLIVINQETEQCLYRLVCFTAMGETFYLLTNRLDLTTGQVIMLYAYRWQVELFFRFLKRTFNGLHLFCEDPDGIEVQFILYMLAYVLLIHFKQTVSMNNHPNYSNRQDCSAEPQASNSDVTVDYPDHDCLSSIHSLPSGLVSLLGRNLHRLWKLGIHWMTKLSELILKPCTPYTLQLLA